MNSAFTHSACNVAEGLSSYFYASVFFQGKWPAKFLETFIPAFLGTGLLLGMIYVLITRAIRIDREAVEAWFETQRLRLQSGPIPIIEKAQPVMMGALYAIYGRSVWRRLATSFFIGAFFSSIIFGFVYRQYKQIPATLYEKKRQLEREVDPKLYDYATNPQLRPEYKKAQQQVVISTPEYSEVEYVYTGGIYDELRDRASKFQPRLVEKLFVNPARVELTLVFLLEGSYINPGFQWLDSIFVFLFNVVLDFCSVTITIICLQQLGRNTSFRTASVTFFYMLIGISSCACVAFFSYRFFFRGNIEFFGQLLIVLPLALGAILAGAAGCIHFIISMFSRRKSEDDWGILYPAFFVFLGFSGLRYVWSYWQSGSLRFVNWHDVFSFPYVLAGTTLIPATLSVVAFGLMLAAKITAEPARVLPEVYMTFVKEEVGGTQAAGIIIILGVIVGTVVGLIWPSN